VITALDHFAQRSDDARTATVCVAVLEPTTGSLRFSTAGHPPPLLVNGAGHRYLTPPGSAPLATGATYLEASEHMNEGDLLLMYTDGIIERPGTHPAQGCADLAATVAAANARWGGVDDLPGPQRVCDETTALLARGTGYRDDVTLLAVQRHRPAGMIELSLPDTPIAVTTARTALGSWLMALRVDDITTSAIQHAVGEVVTNAVEHAYAGRREGSDAVRVRAELTASGIAEITVVDRGLWRRPVEQPYRGMGLTLASEFVDDVRIYRRESGTTVRMRHRISLPVTVSRRPTHIPVAVLEYEPFLAALSSVDDPDATLVVHGPVDAAGAVELRDQLRSATSNGTQSRTVDLSRVTLLASAAVHVLHEARDRNAAHSEDLHLLAPRGSAAHHVLELVGLNPTEQL
jgi:anti-sigma regulatory factor (Ser/Thr protein kinase)/anti-anti-sigma regulatory factor